MGGPDPPRSSREQGFRATLCQHGTCHTVGIGNRPRWTSPTSKPHHSITLKDLAPASAPHPGGKKTTLLQCFGKLREVSGRNHLWNTNIKAGEQIGGASRRLSINQRPHGKAGRDVPEQPSG